MNLPKEAKKVIGEIGETMSNLYMMKLTPLQIMIMIETRYAETKLAKNKHLFAHIVRRSIAKMHTDRNHEPVSRQLFWASVQGLQDRKLIYVAPPKKGARFRAITLTLKGACLFTYPKSIHPYKTYEMQPIK